MVMRSGGSDASDVSKAGIPCLDSVGIKGGNGHSINEWAELSSLAYCAKTLAAVVMELE